MDPRLLAFMDDGLAMSAVDFKRLEFVRTDAVAEARADPRALRRAPLPHDVADRAPGRGGRRALLRRAGDGLYHGLDMTSPFNFVSQCPALSVPCGWSAEGLPIGLQIVARRYRDDLALRIGAVLERVRPWAPRRPPL